MVATTFANLSFELVSGTSPVLTSAVEPYALSDDDVLVLAVNGVSQPIVFEIGTRATITSSAEPFALAHNQTILVSIDGGPIDVVTFLTADFADISAATAVEVAAQLLGATGSFVNIAGGAIRYGSVTKGTASTIDVSGGTAAPALGWPASDVGVQYFVDIGAATASEVSARMSAQLAGVNIAVVALAVEVTGEDQGSDSCMQFLPSIAQGALGFSTTEVCGVSRTGYARGWSLLDVSGHWDFTEFHASPPTLQFPAGVERFDLGWNGNEGDTDELGPLSPANFDGVEDHDSFELWGPYINSLPATAAAVFNTALDARVFEDFEAGWPAVPGNEESVFVIGLLKSATFGGNSSEDFESEWPSSPGNEGDTGVIGPITSAAFGTSSESAEEFTSDSSVSVHYRVLSVALGDTMAILLDGLAHSLLATSTDTTVAAAALAAQVVASILPVSATSSMNNVYVTQDKPGTPLVFGATGQPPGQLVIVYGEAVDPNDTWPGLSYNPDL